MKWLKRLGNTLAGAGQTLWGNRPARRYVLVAVLVASGVGAPAAVSIATAVDQGIEEIESGE